VYWIALSLICIGLDVWAGPHIQFPIVYLVPISLASWYGGLPWGVTLAVVLPLFRLLLYVYEVWVPPSSILESSINAAIRLVVFVSFAWLVDRTSRQMKELRRMTLLEQMLGVCSVCRKVHDEQAGAWEPLEAYVAGHRSDFKHAICPACAGQHRDVFDRR